MPTKVLFEYRGITVVLRPPWEPLFPWCLPAIPANETILPILPLSPEQLSEYARENGAPTPPSSCPSPRDGA
jgi:hypothetical protein